MADLVLRDFSDGFGVLKFNSLVLGYVQKPHLYKVYNDKHLFKLIGSIHILPLTKLSEKVVDFLISQPWLAIECTDDGDRPQENNDSEEHEHETANIEDSFLLYEKLYDKVSLDPSILSEHPELKNILWFENLSPIV